ncbi:Fis family transcriptional regulator [candidate division TA06 bacterium SM1_40]|uniref:Fis family transcriptional regulator n=2 Tax=Bacteria division TA06 TaxID=1156500 RepID=A0A0S8JE05_UNCT6|nr:MAG: Fis family transcriptional regulator [candidate division TA06 bacterium SM23_40]KPL07919.1 MAG: Fis family transcriptional regulator [candidate division TA06 bacterium SM1_40]
MDPSEKKERILVVDDAPDTLELLRRNLTSKGYRVLTTTGVADAIGVLDSTSVDLVITDLKMPGASGLDLVRHVRENLKETEVMMITGYPSVEGAVEAVKTGAEAYLVKPFTDEELFSAVEEALDKLRVRTAARARSHRTPQTPGGIIGDSEAMHGVYGAIGKAASTSATVLITGESGTGKELVARAIHYSSPRASAPFVPVNCGGIPEQLLESELFGYVKGAFTGATETRAGFFQTADGGSIFLDEISNTSLATQAKLLRVLQDKVVCMVGSRTPQKVDVRVVVATNKDLLGLVQKGIFREDLYYRLAVITIEIPPLRERGDDILILVNHFAQRSAEEFGKPTPQFSNEALQVLNIYHWPGNVRELENVIQRLVVMAETHLIDVPDLPSLMRFSAGAAGGLTRSLAEVEAEHILNVLASVDGNKTRAAEILGIDRKTLREKLRKVGKGDAL